MSELKSGIYKITINDYYIYIGQSVDVEKRCNGHLNELKQNKKSYNKKFQNIFNKYPDKIKFEIIELCDVDKLDEREMHWIAFYRSFGTNCGLNMSIGGDCGWRKYRTIEEAEVAALEKRREYYKTHKEEIKQYVKQRYQCNKDRCKKYNKKYRETHKEEIKQYYRQKGILSRSDRHKLQFEKRYNLSRPLTSEEWNTWRTDKSVSGNYSKENAIKFLNTLSNITFYSKIVKFKNK